MSASTRSPSCLLVPAAPLRFRPRPWGLILAIARPPFLGILPRHSGHTPSLPYASCVLILAPLGVQALRLRRRSASFESCHHRIKKGQSIRIGPSLFWSGREDSNLRPLAPHASALPGCATPRKSFNFQFLRGPAAPVQIRFIILAHGLRPFQKKPGEFAQASIFLIDASSFWMAFSAPCTFFSENPRSSCFARSACISFTFFFAPSSVKPSL